MTHREIEALIEARTDVANATKLGQAILVAGPRASGLVVFARELSRRKEGPFRAPHHTCSTVGLLGELALAAGGLLYLDDFQEFRASAVGQLLQTWGKMWPTARPVLVFGMRYEEPAEVVDFVERMRLRDAWQVPAATVDLGQEQA